MDGDEEGGKVGEEEEVVRKLGVDEEKFVHIHAIKSFYSVQAFRVALRTRGHEGVSLTKETILVALANLEKRHPILATCIRRINGDLCFVKCSPTTSSYSSTLPSSSSTSSFSSPLLSSSTPRDREYFAARNRLVSFVDREDDDHWKRIAEEEVNIPIMLEDPLWRFTCIMPLSSCSATFSPVSCQERGADKERELVYDFVLRSHHAISDGVTALIFVNDFLEFCAEEMKCSLRIKQPDEGNNEHRAKRNEKVIEPLPILESLSAMVKRTNEQKQQQPQPQQSKKEISETADDDGGGEDSGGRPWLLGGSVKDSLTNAFEVREAQIEARNTRFVCGYMSREDTARLLRAAKLYPSATVHGPIAAATLLACEWTVLNTEGSCPIALFTNVSLRPYLSPPVDKRHMGCFVSGVYSPFTVEPNHFLPSPQQETSDEDRDCIQKDAHHLPRVDKAKFWELAKQVKDTLISKIEASEHIAEQKGFHQVFDRTFAESEPKLGRLETIQLSNRGLASNLRKIHDCRPRDLESQSSTSRNEAERSNATTSNSSVDTSCDPSSHSSPSSASLSVEELYSFSGIAGIGSFFSVNTMTFNGRLFITIAFVEPFIRREKVEALLRAILHLLRDPCLIS